jgi:hypothetical protein
MKRISLTYVASYLLMGGAGFAFAPALTLRLFFSNGEYGDVMPRVVGMFMLALRSPGRHPRGRPRPVAQTRDGRRPGTANRARRRRGAGRP